MATTVPSMDWEILMNMWVLKMHSALNSTDSKKSQLACFGIFIYGTRADIILPENEKFQFMKYQNESYHFLFLNRVFAVRSY